MRWDTEIFFLTFMCKETTWGSLGLGWGLGIYLFEEASWWCCCFQSVVFCVVRQDCMHELNVFVSTWISQKKGRRKEGQVTKRFVQYDGFDIKV